MNDQETRQRYLATFRQALRPLPASERDDAVREIESHFGAAQAEGQAAASVTAKLGDARTLAKAYLAEQPHTAPAFWQELRRAGLFAGTGFASLIVIPSLLLTAFSFVAAAVMGIFFGFARTFDPSGFHLFGQNLPWGGLGRRHLAGAASLERAVQPGACGSPRRSSVRDVVGAAALPQNAVTGVSPPPRSQRTLIKGAASAATGQLGVTARRFYAATFKLNKLSQKVAPGL